MSIYDYEAAFGAADITSVPMRSAIESWFGAYYGQGEADPCQRIACAVVSKLTRTAFGEYSAVGESDFARRVLAALDEKRKEAIQLALVGGSCLIKPCLFRTGFSFTLIPRTNVLVFGRDSSAVTASEDSNVLLVLEPPRAQFQRLWSLEILSFPLLAMTLISLVERTVPLTSTVPLSAVTL